MILAHVLDILVRLCLWVDHERPASSLFDDDTVFDGGVILRESADVPLLDLNGFPEERSHGDFGIVFEFEFGKSQHPVLFEIRSEIRREGTAVRDHACRDNRMCRHEIRFVVECLDILRPSDGFFGQAVGEFLRAIEFRLAFFDLAC